MELTNMLGLLGAERRRAPAVRSAARVRTLDPPAGAPNISIVEQEFQIPPRVPQGTHVVDRAAHLLVSVLESERPLGLTELAAAVGMPKSSASRLVGALERQGLLGRTVPRGPLAPGPAIMRFARRALVDANLIELAQPALQALSLASGETVNLAVPTPQGVEHVAQVDSTHFLGTGQWLGCLVDYHCTAVGKVFLAFGAAPVPAELAAHTPATIVDPRRLRVELDLVHGRAFATAVDELEPGLTAIAVPVREQGGAVVCALSISGPTLRLGPRRIADLRSTLTEHARALSESLGHREPGEDAA
jgi:IclR family acetate operon transcriptional repressor